MEKNIIIITIILLDLGQDMVFRHLHVKCALGFGCFLASTVANQSTSLGQAKVKGQKRPMLHTDSPQSGAINLQMIQITVMKFEKKKKKTKKN